VVNKITWQKAGRVTNPGRYMFTFWKQFPEAVFTLVKIPAAVASEPGDADVGPGDVGAGDAAEDFHLGAFELSPNS
jgi:hypothetical protein